MPKSSVLTVLYFLIVCHIAQIPLTASAQHSIDTANVASVLENMYGNDWDTQKDVANVHESAHDATLVFTNRASREQKKEQHNHPSSLQASTAGVGPWGCGVAGCIYTTPAFSQDNVSAHSISRIQNKHLALSHNIINMQTEHAGDEFHVDDNSNDDIEHSASDLTQLHKKTHHRIAQRAEKRRLQHEDSHHPNPSNWPSNVASSDIEDSLLDTRPLVQLHDAATLHRQNRNAKKITSMPADSSFENPNSKDASLRRAAFAHLRLERRQHETETKRLGNIRVPLHHALPRTHAHLLLPGYARKVDPFEHP